MGLPALGPGRDGCQDNCQRQQGCPESSGQPWLRSSDEISDGFLELLGGAEGDLLARLDLDRLAGRGIAAHASGALAHLKDSQAADADAVALLEVLDHQADEVVEDEFGLLLRHLVADGEGSREMLQRDGGLCYCGLCHESSSLYGPKKTPN